MKGYCVNCEHFDAGGRSCVEQYCTRVENEKKLNYVTGETAYAYGKKYPFAYEINGVGQCDEFVVKS